MTENSSNEEDEQDRSAEPTPVAPQDQQDAWPTEPTEEYDDAPEPDFSHLPPVDWDAELADLGAGRWGWDEEAPAEDFDPDEHDGADVGDEAGPQDATAPPLDGCLVGQDAQASGAQGQGTRVNGSRDLGDPHLNAYLMSAEQIAAMDERRKAKYDEEMAAVAAMLNGDGLDDPLEQSEQDAVTPPVFTSAPTSGAPAYDRAAALAVEVERLEVREEAKRIVAAKKPRKSIRSMMLTRAELDGLPEVEPLVEGFLFRASTAVLYGRRNAGKTFVALDMALSVATGHDWQAGKTRQGRVLWLCGEGGRGLNARIRAWESYNNDGKPIPDSAFTVVDGSVQLGDETVVNELTAIVTEEAYDLIVIDTLAKNSLGLEENSATDMKLFFEHLDRVRSKHSGATVLVIHHAGKSETVKDARGSTVIEDSPETVLRLSGSDVTDVRLETTKQRDSARAELQMLCFHEHGNSLVVGEQDPRGPGRLKAGESDKVVTLLQELYGAGVWCSRSSLRDAVMEEHGVSRNTANRWITDATEHERIEIDSKESQRPNVRIWPVKL